MGSQSDMIHADILIKGGLIIDGSGAPGYKGDVAILGDEIIAIGDVSDLTVNEVINADGMIVSPGFIDVHSHDDYACIAKPDMRPKISQGVTTVVTGNCGISVACADFPDKPQEPFNLLGDDDAFRFPSFSAYRDAVEKAQPRTNIAAMVGHSNLRIMHMSDLDIPANDQQVSDMQKTLDQALDDGAVGLSSGLFYRPAQSANIAELAALGGIVSAKNAIYTAHIRDEYDEIVAALQEAFDTAEQAGARLVISHHKCAGVKNWGRSTETLGLIDDARVNLDVALDCYPYVAGSTVIRPELADGEIKVRINWSEEHPEVSGHMLHDVAAKWDCSEREAAERLLPGGASYFQIHEDDMQRILAHPACMIGSDGLPNDPRPHPRLWGTFPRVLGRYTREQPLFNIETAIHKMTGLAARNFGLSKRGFLRTGYKADITIFDPEEIADRATYENPCQQADGINMVIINGAVGWRNGAIYASRNGRVLGGKCADD